MYTQRAPAKINLGLHVLRRRSDGFHAIESVLLPIGWFDTVTVRPAADLSMTCSDRSLPVDDRNLCRRAARRLAEAAGIPAGAAIHLDKRIPVGAGLGGGSSDAAAALRLLAKCWKLSPSEHDLRRIAQQIGSDVPFFLEGRAAYATGRGGVLEPLEYACPYTLLVVKPPVSIATPDAYGLVEPSDKPRPDLRTLVRSDDLDRWSAELTNDFEQPVFARYPQIRAVKERLLEEGAAFASLSGSGSAVFGVFRDLSAARGAANRIKASDTGYEVWCGN